MDAPALPSVLCLSCGYSLAGLPLDGACPECNRAVADSLAEPRIGSRWQRRSGGLLAAAFEAAMSPDRMMRRLQPDGPRERPLVLTCTLVASAVPAWMVGAILTPPLAGARPWTPRPLPMSASEWLVHAGVIWAALAVALWAMVGAVRMFLRLSGALSPGIRDDTSRAIAAHASLGLVCGAAGGWIAITVIAGLTQIAGVLSTRDAALYAAIDCGAGLGVGILWSLYLLGDAVAVHRPRRND